MCDIITNFPPPLIKVVPTIYSMRYLAGGTPKLDRWERRTLGWFNSLWGAAGPTRGSGKWAGAGSPVSQTGCWLELTNSPGSHQVEGGITSVCSIARGPGLCGSWLSCNAFKGHGRRLLRCTIRVFFTFWLKYIYRVPFSQLSDHHKRLRCPLEVQISFSPPAEVTDEHPFPWEQWC